MGYVQTKIGLMGQFDWRQPGNYLQPWAMKGFNVAECNFIKVNLESIGPAVCLAMC